MKVYVLTGNIGDDRLIISIFKNREDAEAEKSELIEKLAESSSAYDLLTIEEFDVEY